MSFFFVFDGRRLKASISGKTSPGACVSVTGMGVSKLRCRLLSFQSSGCIGDRDFHPVEKPSERKKGQTPSGSSECSTFSRESLMILPDRNHPRSIQYTA